MKLFDNKTVQATSVQNLHAFILYFPIIEFELFFIIIDIPNVFSNL